MTDDKGGLLPPGDIPAVNCTGRPEMVRVSRADWHWDEEAQRWVYDSGWGTPSDEEAG